MPVPPQPPVVVLVRPQLAENIGAVARAMANFGAADLRLVCPRPFDETLAARTACDGRGLLARARVFPDLRAAVADCALAVGTTRRPRRVKLPAWTPEQAASRLRSLPGASRAALVFGAEQAGLTNEELFLCDATSSIPASELGSLNLGQAALLYLYSWFAASPLAGAALRQPAFGRRLATHAEKQRVYDMLEKLLQASGYRPVERLPEFLRRVKLLFEDRPLTEREQRILLKLLRQLDTLTERSQSRRP